MWKNSKKLVLCEFWPKIIHKNDKIRVIQNKKTHDKLLASKKILKKIGTPQNWAEIGQN